MSIQEGTNNVPQQTFVQWNDPKGTELVGINRDGTIFTQGIEFPDGTVISTSSTGSAIPIIQARLDGVNITVVKTLSITASPSVNQLYAISLFEQSAGVATAGHTLVTTITYTSPAVAGTQTVTITMPLDSANIVMETYPFLVAAGAALTLTTSYGGGAINDAYTISARLVQMP